MLGAKFIPRQRGIRETTALQRGGSDDPALARGIN